MIHKGGMTYWVPTADRELSSVNSYIRWEQAFRVYMNIFASANPWDSVYKYDCEFRIHMSEHPERNWRVILQ